LLAAQEALADFLNRGLERPSVSEPLARQTWQARARVLGPDHRDTLDSLDTYGLAVLKSGRVDEAIVLQRNCLAARRRVLGARHPDTMLSLTNLASALLATGEWTEAIPLFREGLDAIRDTGPETEFALNSSSLAGVLHVTGDLAGAEKVLQEAVERAARRLGPEDLLTYRLRGLQARVWIDQGRLEQAVSLSREVLARRRQTMPPGHVAIGATLMDLGHGLALQGRFDEAVAALQEVLKIFAQSPPPQSYYVAWTECWLGASFTGLRRYSEAELQLVAAEQKLRSSTAAPRRYHGQCVLQLIKLYEAWGKPEQAAHWRKR
jgi:tetratricopeptide (TPR) repeat protein